MFLFFRSKKRLKKKLDEDMKSHSSIDNENAEKFEIPEGTVIIPECAFSGRSVPEKITLPEGLTEIDDLAFEKCVSLHQIKMPSTLERIGNCAFWGCIHAATRLSDTLLSLQGESYADVPIVAFGPFEAPVYRVDNVYRLRMVIKCRLTRRSREMWRELMRRFMRSDASRGAHAPMLSIDFNPSSI